MDTAVESVGGGTARLDEIGERPDVIPGAIENVAPRHRDLATSAVQ